MNDIFAFTEELKRAGYKDYYNYLLRRFSGPKYLLGNLLINVVDFAYKENRNSYCDLLFIGSKFKDIILDLRSYLNVQILATGKMDRHFCIDHKIPYISGNKVKNQLVKYCSLKAGTSPKKERLANNILNKAMKILSQNYPKAIVLWNDGLFLERTFIVAARHMRIPSIAIQDGVFHRNWMSFFWNGFADYVCVWGDYFKQLYIDKGIKENRLFVLGYPFSLIDNISIIKNTKPKVCFLGQDLENYKQEFLSLKYAVLRNVVKACEEIKIPLLYRPHPNENQTLMIKEFPGIKIIDKSVPLRNVISDSTIFIGISSTALVEAVLCGKIAIQIIESPNLFDVFQDLGICYTINNDYGAIYQLLMKIITNKCETIPFNPNYIVITNKPSLELLEIFRKIGIDFDNVL